MNSCFTFNALWAFVLTVCFALFIQPSAGLTQKDGGLSDSARWLLPPSVASSRWIIIAVASTLFIGYWSLSSRRRSRRDNNSGLPALPADLEDKTYAQFDSMVSKRRIYYEDTGFELYTHKGFQFEFRVASMLKHKPVLAPDAPGRVKSSGPFVHPNPDEVVTDIGKSHRLLLNKYCLYRPMLVLPTREFALQEDDLDPTDLSAIWAIIKAFSTPLLMIYNCGVNSGSSQGHKHMQLFALPQHELWPSKATTTQEVASKIPNVPFKHYVMRIPARATVTDIITIHDRLLALTKEALVQVGDKSGDYNVAMTSEWMVLIPRTTYGPNGPSGANAAGMLGLVAVGDAEERQRWAELGYTNYLTYLGIPVDEGRGVESP